jgi:probable F420-dependent oxidoreductase
MRTGAVFPTTSIGSDPQAITDFAQGVEELGFDHLLCYDHVLGATHAGRQPRLRGPYDDSHEFHEPFVLLAWLAAKTRTLGLFPAIIVAPQRQTALLAKQATELQNLSTGRLRLGIGVGWNWVEFEALNANFELRAKVIEEQVGVLRMLWSQRIVDFKGDFHRIDRAGLAPLPAERIALWFGGYTENSFVRSATLGDGHVFGHLNDSAFHGARKIMGHVERVQGQVAPFGLEAIADYSSGRNDWVVSAKRWMECGGTHLSIRTERTLGVSDSGCRNVDDHLRAFRIWRDTLMEASLLRP